VRASELLKDIVYNCFDVLNPKHKSFQLLVEWNIIKDKIICVFVDLAMSLSLLLRGL